MRSPIVWAVHSLPAAVVLTISGFQLQALLTSVFKGLGATNDPDVAIDAMTRSLDFTPAQISAFRIACLLSLVGLWMVFFTGAGVCQALRKVQAGLPIDVNDVFAFRGRFFNALAVSAAMAIGITLAYGCCYFPGLAAEGYSLTANQRAVDRGEGFLDAFAGSSSRVRSQMFAAGASVHVLLFMLLLGGCVPLLGYMIGVPLYNISRGLFYLRLSEEEGFIPK